MSLIHQKPHKLIGGLRCPRDYESQSDSGSGLKALSSMFALHASQITALEEVQYRISRDGCFPSKVRGRKRTPVTLKRVDGSLMIGLESRLNSVHKPNVGNVQTQGCVITGVRGEWLCWTLRRYGPIRMVHELNTRSSASWITKPSDDPAAL